MTPGARTPEARTPGAPHASAGGGGAAVTSSHAALVRAGVALVVIAIVAVGILVLGIVAEAAAPMATPAIVAGGDPRSEGSGPGLVGSPVLVLGAVVGLGIATVLVTILLARIARRS
jgi:hypothetical protein